MVRKKREKPGVIPKLPRRSFLQRLRGNFLAGIVLVGPVALTIYLAWTAITVIDAAIVPWVPAAYNPGTYLGADVPGFGVIVFLLFTAIIGWLTKNFFGRQLVRLGEGWVSRMPVIRSIYNALKQIAETILSQSQTSFRKACLIEYPRRGLWAVAFVSTDTRGEIPTRTGVPEMISVFLPTTPNPTSGFLLFVPRADVVLLDMSVEDAAKLVISAGLVTPPTKAEIAAGVAVRRPEPVN
ncbi:DUF502 domain-containing protein [Pikeienuella piscinae]|uniref:DUF502 domain-containing protein n=1 Tax=Pikeienuella piscinae TaxID=2748098 RepID=A0A7L5BVR4_9RHOB|nr:DUF502 domain-containing protein [Pikeienuella piscinae]QIE54296.1 DUF502 domain-containing protein [Pikeienuella piscinae]